MNKPGILSISFLIIAAMNAYAASSESQWEKGKEAYDKGEYSKAIPYFKKATELDPQRGDLFRWLGNAYYDSGQYEKAVDAYKQALSLPHNKGNEEESCRWLTEGYRRLGQLDLAISSQNNCVELSPDNPNHFVRLGYLYNLSKQYDEAITACKRAIELHSNNASAYSNLSWAYRYKKQYDEAFNAIKKAIEIDPAKVLYRRNMAELFYDKSDYSEAIEALKKAVELEPANVSNLVYIGNLYRLLGKYDDAIAASNKAIALQTYTGLGILLTFESDHPVAKEVTETGPAKKAGIEAGDKIIKINGKSTKGWNSEKTMQSLGGASGTQVVLTIEREGARKSIDKTVARETMVNKEAASSFALRSIAYRHKGSPEAALPDAEKAYSLDPANEWALYSLGAAYLDRGQYDDASKLLAQVKGPRARMLEATAYAKQGKLDEAVNIYCSIPEEEITPKNVPLMSDRMALLQIFKPVVTEHRDKASSFEEKGQYKEALSDLSEALKTADEAEAQAIRESMFRMTREDPSLSEMPEEARRYVLRGEMLVKEGNFEQAAKEFEKAIRIAPYEARLYKKTALINAESKKYSEAIRQMKIYLQAAPDAPDARAAKDEITKWEFMMEKEKQVT